MTESKRVIRELGNKLEMDIKDTTYSDGSDNLHYVMSIRIQDAVLKAMKEVPGFDDHYANMDVASISSDIFLNGLIELSKKDV